MVAHDEISAGSMVVPRGEGGGRAPTLAALVREVCQVSWGKARDLCARGKVQVDGEVCTDSAQRISPGSQVEVDPGARRVRPTVLEPGAFVHLDRDVVVVRKPAGIMTVPFGPGDQDTLVDRLRVALKRRAGRPVEPGVVQRLDKDTTGILVFACTLAAKRHLQQQLRVHSVERVYYALVHGVLQGPRKVESQLLRDRGDGLRGSYGHFRKPRGPAPADAQRAITEFAPVKQLRGATLVRCKLFTGRQHQVRIHLAEAGHPLVGERVYIRDYRGPVIPAPRPMLHATRLGFTHPRSDEWLLFDEPPPEGFQQVLRGLELGEGA